MTSKEELERMTSRTRIFLERWLELIRLNGGSNRLTVVLRFEEESK